MDTSVWIVLALLMPLKTQAMIGQPSSQKDYQTIPPNMSPNSNNMPPDYSVMNSMPQSMNNIPSGMNNMQSGVNIPSGMNSMQSGVNNMQSGVNIPQNRNNMQSSMNNMQSGVNIPSGMNNMQSGMNIPQNRNNMQSSMNNMQSGVNIPSGMNSMQSGMNIPSGMNSMQTGMNIPSGMNNMESGMNIPSHMNNMQSSMNIPSHMETMQSGMTIPSRMNNMQSSMSIPPSMNSMQSGMSIPPSMQSGMNIPTRMDSMSASSNMFNMPQIPNLSALSSMLPGYPCDTREAPCPGDQVCRMAASAPCYSPPCPPAVIACVSPSSEAPTSGASCPMGQPILDTNRFNELQCGPGRGQCPSKTYCHIDAADNLYTCCWQEQTAASSLLSGGWPGLNPNPALPGFPPQLPTSPLERLRSLQLNTGMTPTPSFNIPSPVNQNMQGMWQQNRPSSNGMFPSRASGNGMFPQLPGIQQQPGVTQNGAMSNQYSSGSPGMFPTGQRGGSQPMYQVNTPQGYMPTGPNQFTNPNQPLFRTLPSEPGGYPNDSQMGYQDPQSMGVHYGMGGQFPNPPLPPRYSSWSPNGLPPQPTYPPTPKPTVNTQPESSQPNESTQGGPKILIPGAAFDKHLALQNALKSISSGQEPSSPGTDQPVANTTSPDGQNTTSAADNTTTDTPVYPTSDGIWTPQSGSASVNVSDTPAVQTKPTGPGTGITTGPGIGLNRGPGAPSTQLPVSPFPSTTQHIGLPNTGTLYPPNIPHTGSTYPSRWQQYVPSHSGQYPPAHQDPIVKPGFCPQVFSIGGCRDSCVSDGDCLFTFKCCSIGRCKTCMHEEKSLGPCSFYDRANGRC